MRGAASAAPTPTSSSSRPPLRILVSGGDLPFGYGTFFHHYRLNGTLIGVSVLDVLPSRTASVYFFYNPELREPLQLGKLSVLVEAWLTQQLCAFTAAHPQLSTLLPRGLPPLGPWLDLNYYVHSCRPMRYKNAYAPSQLLCPVLGRGAWAPLDAAARARLDGDPGGPLAGLAQHGGPDGVRAHAARVAAEELALGLQQVLPSLLCRLRSGQCLTYEGLSEASQAKCRSGLAQWLSAAGPQLASRVLVDPNGVSYVGWLVEQHAEKLRRAEEEEAAAAAEAAEAPAAVEAVEAAVAAEAVEAVKAAVAVEAVAGDDMWPPPPPPPAPPCAYW